MKQAFMRRDDKTATRSLSMARADTTRGSLYWWAVTWWAVLGLCAGLCATLVLPAAAQEGTEPAEAASVLDVTDGYDVDLTAYRWTHRPVVVFADSPADPRYQEQIDRLLSDAEALVDRDVVLLVDTDPTAQSALRRKLRPHGFMLVLIGKDGGVKLRKPLPWSVREISRTIDKMPMRLREVEERREG